MSQCITVSPVSSVSISSGQIAQHEGLVRWVVLRQYLGDISLADALHEGRIGLWRALQRYDPSHGTAFSTYAVPAIARAVWHAVRSSSPSPSPHLPVSLLVEEPSDPIEDLCSAEIAASLHSLINSLPPRLRLIIVARFGLDGSPPQTFARIGHSLGVTRQRAHQLNQDALNWLAHPAHSLDLRRLTGHLSRSDYQFTLSRQRELARARRAGSTTKRRNPR